MSAGSLVIVTKWKKSVTGTRNVLNVLLGYLVPSGNMRGRAAILHVAFIRFQLVCLFVRSHIACISSGEGVKELPGRHVKPQFCNFLLACSDFFFFFCYIKKSIGMYVFASCGHCLPVILGRPSQDSSHLHTR